MRELRDIPAGCTLGLNYTRLHDSAIAVVDPDGRPAFACSLERLTRLKQDGSWPAALLDAVPWDRIAEVAISSLTFEDARRLGEEYRRDVWPWPRKSTIEAIAVTPHPPGCEELYAGLPEPRSRFDHHLAHAASAHFLSGFERSLVLTCDAGAFQCPWHAAAYVASGDEVHILGGVHFVEFLSPAHLYTLVTALLGLRPNRHEGKVTGLAARGRIDDSQFARFEESAWRMTEQLGRLLRWDVADGGFAPTMVVNVEQRDAWRRELEFLDDTQLAACAQRVAEERALGLVRCARELADASVDRVCLAGGLFSNVRVNQCILESGFEDVFVVPPMTDDGTALGAAQLAHVRRHGGASPRRHRTTMYLGPGLEDEAIDRALQAEGITVERTADVAGHVAGQLAEGRVVGVARARMEFGPRALGHRSVLAEATDPTINDWLNHKLQRTEYMPFAPMLLKEDAERLLEGVGRFADTARFMTITADCRPEMVEKAPAAVHVDGTARPQILAPGDDPFCEAVLHAYRERTGIPVLINTSFNVHEQPITCSVEDALRGFAQTRLDWLVLGDRLISYEANVAVLEAIAQRAASPGTRSMSQAQGLSRWLTETRSANDDLVRKSTEIFEAKQWNEKQAANFRESCGRLQQALERERERVEAATRELGETKARLERLERAIARAKQSGLVLESDFEDTDPLPKAALVPRDVRSSVGWDSTDPDYSNTPADPRRVDYGYSPVDPEAEPFVTIITPFYDTGPVFEETARSVLQQSFQQWEWVIVDDGSTDPDALEMLARTADSDPRIRVVRQENRGLPGARNTGFRHARADFVVQLDSDDLIEPTALDKWLWFLLSHPEYAIAKGYTVGFGAQEYLWRRGFHEAQTFLVENIVTVTGMIRRRVHEEVGGYDESIRGGFEDWDYWLKIADAGHWGGTIPEFLDWYRRRSTHTDKWGNWDSAEQFRAELRRRYPELWSRGINLEKGAGPISWQTVPADVPCANRLGKSRRRLLMILPWMTLGGADRFNLDLLDQLTRRGFEVSIATTLHGENLWEHEFLRYTPDVFVLERFLPEKDYPRFLRYLIQSRDVDTVMVTHSLFGYMLLPYLRASCPGVTFMDYCHAEYETWVNGGYPRFAVANQVCLDLNVVSSEHLKRWMVRRGADPDSIEVCYTSVDCQKWRPDAEARAREREQLGVPADHTVLIYPVRICDQKQPKVFAETVRKLARSGREFTALVAGDGPDRAWLEGFLSRHGLRKSVQMLGAVPAERMPALMAASDVLFLPSKLEGIALSLFEAMASRVVVVGADVGGQRELVTSECGFLLDREQCADEPTAYAELLGRLIDDPDLREQMADRALDRVLHGFRLEDMGERMVELIGLADKRRVSEPRPRIDTRIGHETANAAVEYWRLENLAAHLWRTREERLGMQRTWRTVLWNAAVRVHNRLPPKLQKLAATSYRRLFVRRS